MRKTEILAVEVKGQPVTLQFQRFTLKQEEEWCEWVQQQTIADCRRMFLSFHTPLQSQMTTEVAKSLSVGSCSLTGGHGIQAAVQGAGMRQFLKMAASEKHPGIDDETLYEIVCEHHEDCLRIVQELLPIRIDLTSLLNLSGKNGEKK